MPNPEDLKKDGENKETPPTNEKGKDTNPSTAEEYAAALAKVRKETVSRADYEKLRAEHSALIEKTANGEIINEPTPEVDNRDYHQIASDFLKNNDGALNLNRAKEMLKYRDAMLKAGKYDPFAPYSRDRSATQDEINKASKFATILKDCVDNCADDPEVFNTLFEKHCRVQH